MPTVYIRKDNYDAIVSMGYDPTAYVNHLLDTTFEKKVSYTPKDEQHQKAITKKTTPKGDKKE